MHGAVEPVSDQQHLRAVQHVEADVGRREVLPDGRVDGHGVGVAGAVQLHGRLQNDDGEELPRAVHVQSLGKLRRDGEGRLADDPQQRQGTSFQRADHALTGWDLLRRAGARARARAGAEAEAGARAGGRGLDGEADVQLGERGDRQLGLRAFIFSGTFAPFADGVPGLLPVHYLFHAGPGHVHPVPVGPDDAHPACYLLLAERRPCGGVERHALLPARARRHVVSHPHLAVGHRADGVDAGTGSATAAEEGRQGHFGRGFRQLRVQRRADEPPHHLLRQTARVAAKGRFHRAGGQPFRQLLQILSLAAPSAHVPLQEQRRHAVEFVRFVEGGRHLADGCYHLLDLLATFVQVRVCGAQVFIHLSRKEKQQPTLCLLGFS